MSTEIGQSEQSPVERMLEEVRQLSPEQISELTARLLEMRTPGRQPLDVFTQLARLSTIGTVEIAPVRDANRTEPPQILLSRRPDDDPFWPGLWHLPGNVVVARQQTAQTVIMPMEVFADGVLENEFEGVKRVGNLDLFDSHVRTGARGTELTSFYISPVDLMEGYSEPVGGSLFSFDKVREQIHPDNMISGHPETLLKAMRAYRRRN